MRDEYQAYKRFCLEVPISTNNIFINDKPAFTDDFCDNDALKTFLHIGSAVYMPIIKDSGSAFTKRADIRIGTLYDIDLSSRTITIELDTVHKGKEIGNMLSEIDDNTFHYYAGLNIYVRLDRFQLEKSNIFLLRVSHHDDEIKSKANTEHNSECDSPFSPSIVAENDSDDADDKINNIDASPFLTKEEAAKTYLAHNSIDLSNYYTKSQVDALIKNQQIISNSSSSIDINNRYDENMLIPITASNVESWIARYIYSDSDRFRNYISCGTRFTIQDGVYNAQWVVVGADTELNKGDVPLTKPHLSLIPVTNLGTHMMNSFGTTAGACVGSKMYKETIPAIVAALQKVLGNHLLARRVKLANSIDGNGKSNGSAYYTVYANLLCERQIWGTSDFENSYDIGDDNTALPGFSNYRDKIYGSSHHFWLRSVSSHYSFVLACSDGSVNYHNAYHSHGVRPLITIG